MKAFTDFLDRMTGHLEHGPVSKYVDNLNPEAKIKARYNQKKERLVAEMGEKLEDQTLAKKLFNPAPADPKNRLGQVEAQRYAKYSIYVTARLIDKLPILQYKIKLLVFPIAFLVGLLGFSAPSGVAAFVLFSSFLTYVAATTYRVGSAVEEPKGIRKVPMFLLRIAARHVTLSPSDKNTVDAGVAKDLLYPPVKDVPEDLDDITRPAIAGPSGESLAGKYNQMYVEKPPLEKGVRIFCSKLIGSLISPATIGLVLGMAAVASPATPVTMGMLSFVLLASALGCMCMAVGRKDKKMVGPAATAGGVFILVWLIAAVTMAPSTPIPEGVRVAIFVGMAVAYLVAARISVAAPRKNQEEILRLMNVVAKGEDAAVGISQSRRIEQETQPKLALLEKQRIAQREAAAKDKSPLYTLGKSTGYLAGRNVVGAPQRPGMPVRLSETDLSEHLLALGETGSGKTSQVLNPLMERWAEGENGLVVADGKGVLPSEAAAKIPGLKLISPLTCPEMNPIQGYTPPQVTSALRDALGNGGSESVWEQQGKKLVMSSAYMLRLCVEHGELGWCLDNLQKIAESDDEATKIVKKTFEAAAGGEPSAPNRRLSLQEVNSYEYLYHILPNVYAKETSSSIRFNVDAWFAGIAIDEFEPWLTSSSGFELESVLKGGRIGIDLPYRLYGAAGARMAKLLKRRIYNAVQGRIDDWRERGEKPFLFVMDEAQDLVDREDNEILAKSRSLGCYVVVSTQSTDAIQIALQTKEAAGAFFGNLKSLLALRTNTPDALKFVSERLGEVLAPANDLYGSIHAHQASAAYGLRTSELTSLEPEHWIPGIEPKKKGKNENPASGAWVKDLWDLRKYKPIDNRDTAVDHKNTIPAQTILSASDLSQMLGRGLAVVSISRAGQYRREVISLGDEANMEAV